MVKKYTSKALLLLAALAVAPAIFAERPTAVHDDDEVEVSVKKEAKKDFDLKFVGRVAQDAWIWQKPLFFGKDTNDAFWYMKSKVEAGVQVKHGEKIHDKPMGEAAVVFGSDTYWQYQNPYTPMTHEVVTSSALGGVAMADKHRHTTIVPMVFMKEGWYKINLDTVTDLFKSFPVSVQAGFFRYEIGRGIALGYHGDLSNTYAGWEGRSGNSRFPYMPPGVLIRGEMSKNFSFDLYYNKWRSNNADLGSSGMLSPVFQNRLDWGTIYRGKDKDRDTFAVRGDITLNPAGKGKLAVQPYFIYTRAPELPIESEADSKARLGTVGCMTEWDSSGWNVNVEFAGQFGKQQMFAWDRNTIGLERDGATGNVKETYSHLRLAAAGANHVAISAGKKAAMDDRVLKAASLPANRTLASNGKQLIDAAGAVVQNGMAVYNSNYWGNPRIRPAYNINYSGLMGVADVAYSFKEIPLKAAVAVAYIGGDSYPYNTENGSNQEQSKSYKAFITQRSAYGGKNVESIMLFQQPAILRPTNIVNRKLGAENNFLDIANLQFIGADVVWSPLDSKKLSIKPCVLGFWEVAQVKKWDANAQHPETAIRNSLKAMGVTGWYGEQNASKFLGVEMNAIINYQLFKGCKYYFKGFMFKPGQLYADLNGQPNIQGVRANTDGTRKVIMQGTELAYGCNSGFEYKF